MNSSIDPGVRSPRRVFQRFFAAAIAVLLAGVTAPARSGAAQTLHSRAAALAGGLQPLGAVDGASRLNLTLSLPLRNKPALTNLLGQLYDPASPNFHRYLTPAEFAARFGPTEADYQAVVDFAQTHGLDVRAKHSNRTLLEVRGSASAVESAFHVRLQRYQHPTEARTFFAPDRDPAADLSVPLLGVKGLDNYSLPHPNHRHLPLSQAPANRPRAGSGLEGLYMGNDFRAAYVPGVALNGSNQSVALLEFDGYDPSDILQYESNASLPNVALTNVLLDAFDGTPQSQDGQVEVSLDISMAISMAPGLASVIVYEGEMSDDILNRMATDDLANQLSSSWSWAPMDETTEQIFQQFGAQGQSMFQASGDSGAYVGPIPPPSDDPYLTVVGGTTLTTAGPGGPWVSETVWNWFSTGLGQAAGSGGVSTVYPIPAWQQGLDLSKSQGSATMRNIPDVALTADNVLVIAAGQTWYVGGTSCATPLWAALTALINEQQAANNQPPVGFLNPAIYALATSSRYGATFHDITTGNNTNYSSPTAFFALPGYDLCTGWGTPTGSNTIAALVTPADPLLVSPIADVFLQGVPGGPFNAASQPMTLTNGGGAALNWTLGNPTAWLRASLTGGTLVAGGPARTVTVSLNSLASNLAVGIYNATLWFTNQNDHLAQARRFTLEILPLEPPLIVAQPQSQVIQAGATAVFNVTAQGRPLFYQWQKNGTNLTDGGHISGSATAALTVANAGAADAAVYSVIVSNSLGTAAGAAVTLELYALAPGAMNLVQNGGFETGNFSYWNEAGYYYYAVVSSNPLYVHSGAYGAALGEYYTVPGFLYQTLSTTPGNSYLISMWLHSPDGVAPNQFDVLWNGATIFGATNMGAGPWTQLQFLVTATSAASILQLGYADESSDLGLDDVSVSNVTISAAPPAIVNPPASQSAGSGSAAVFTVTAAGTVPLGYQWEINGATLNNGGNVAGATTATLTLSNVSAASDATYSVVVSNAYGTTVSSGATLTVLPATQTVDLITFDDLPDNETLLPVPGGYAGLSWSNFLQLDGINYPYPSGYAAAVISASNVAVNASGEAASISSANPFTLLSAYLTAPWNDNLEVEAQGFSGARVIYDNTYTLSATQPTLINFNYAGVTRVNFIASGGTAHLAYADYPTEQFAMDNVAVAISSAPQIISQPAGRNAPPGATVTFGVTVNGAAPLVYQWQRNGIALTDGGPIAGSATATLTLTGVAAANAGIYSVLVTNVFGSVASAGAGLVLYNLAPGATNLVQNGGFETGTFANWTLFGETNYDYVGSYYIWVHSGAYGAALSTGGNGFGYLSQTLSTTPGASYLVSFWAENPFGETPNQFLVSWNGNPIFSQDNFDSLNWTNLQFLVTAAGSNSVLEFGYSFEYYDDYFGLDDVTATNVIIDAAAPTITSQPASQLVAPGGSAVFDVTALASPPPGYQWQFNGTNLSDTGGITGSATSALTVANASPANAGTYTVVISNAYGTAISAPALLSLPPPGQIFNLLTFDDLPDTESGLAVSNGYQGFGWANFYELDGVNFPGPSGYNAAVVSASNVVYNGGGAAATITNEQPFSLISAYLTAAWRDGLEVEVSGYAGGALLNRNTYILNATEPTLIQFNYAGVDTVEFVSYGGTAHAGYAGTGEQFAMDNVTLLVSASPPQIAAEPASQVAPVGSTVSFSVSATGAAPLSYQWQKNGVPLGDGGNVSGSATAALTLTAVSAGDDGVYAVTVNNSAGAAASSGAALTVYSVVAGATNTVQNGGFETGDFTGWTLSGSTNDIFISTNSSYAHSGRDGAQLGPGSPPGGLLSQTLSTAPGTAYLLSFWLDSPDGLTPNEFLVSWNGAVLFDQSNLGALGWTNLQFVVEAASAASVLQFEFLDAPSYLGLDDITLQSIDLTPSILTPPASQTACAGQTVTFTVAAAGSGPLAYHWRRNGASLSDGSGLSGTAAPILTLSNVAAANSGAYSVVVSNAFGSATSAAADLTVYAVASGASNLVQNGGFETGDFTGWTLAGNSSYSYVASGAAYAHTGNYSAQLGDNAYNFGYGGSLSQPLSTTPGTSYRLSLWLENSTGLVPNLFLVSWNGATVFNQTNLTGQGWENLQFIVTAQSSVTLLQFEFEDELAYLGLDDVSVSNITVGGAPLVTVPPALQTVPPGAQAAFHVVAVGGAPLAYHWQLNGTNLTDGGGITGSTTSNLTIAGVSAANAGGYAVSVTNSYGSVTSSMVPLTVLPPAASLITFDDLAETTSGLPIPAGYHGLTWSNFDEMDGVYFPIPGGYGAGVVSPNNIAFNSGGYPAAISGGTFSLLSARLTAAWNDELEVEAIGYYNGTVVYDGSFTLSATAPALVDFNYQGIDQVLFIASGGTPHLPYSQAPASQFVIDNVVISPAAGPPQITTQPASQAVPAGTTATFNVSAEGSAPLSYQWRMNGANLTSGGALSGATSSALTISNVTAANVGSYSVVVSNSYGAATSSDALLTLLPAGTDLITFDDLEDIADGAYIPDGYHGLIWNNFAELDGVNYGQPSGYGAGVVSPNNIAFNAGGYPAGLIAAGPFNLLNAYLTAAWNDNLQVEVIGFAGGELAYDTTYTLSATQPMLVNFNYMGVDEVNFISSGGTPHLAYGNYPGYQFVMDNVLIGPAQAPPQIAVQPAGQIVPAGTPVSLAVAATGSAPLSYQWQRNGLPLTDGGNLSGSATSNLTFSAIAASNAGVYSVTITNPFGLAASAPAVLAVYSPAPGASNLVQNGGFETGDFTGWTLSGDTNDSFVTSYAPFVHSGTYGAEMGPPSLLGALLSQSVPTTPGGTYLLSVWLANPYATPPNAIQITWNGGTVYNQQNMGYQTWLNPQFIVTASTTNSVLLLDVQNEFGAFGLDDISVSNVVAGNLGTPPQISGPSFTVAGGQFSFSWTAQVGQSYQVQYTTNLAHPTWINLGPSTNAIVPVMTTSDTIAGHQRFYRVALLP
ncbi:MAG: immunoglobulin domain-containing protein [Verrucomicrobiota bacterium]|jgi:hypothetical protein